MNDWPAVTESTTKAWVPIFALGVTNILAVWLTAEVLMVTLLCPAGNLAVPTVGDREAESVMSLMKSPNKLSW